MKNIVAVGSEQRTRARVAQLLLERGSASAAELGAELGLSPAGVRRHLDAMLADGSVTEVAEAVSTARGRGRPARHFALTDAGRDAFPHAYDDLATAALRFLADRDGKDAIAAFAASRVADLERRYADRLAKAKPAERVAVLAAALTEDGYAASSDGGEVCQHHCPVQHVATEFPELCEAETEVFGRLLGRPVIRLTTIAHGESCCTARFTDATPRSAS